MTGPLHRYSPAVYYANLMETGRMTRIIRDTQKILGRIRRIRGQAKALERLVMLEKNPAAVLQQIAAIRGAVNGLLAVVLEGQLHRHERSKVAMKQHHLEHRQLIDLMKVCLK